MHAASIQLLLCMFKLTAVDWASGTLAESPWFCLMIGGNYRGVSQWVGSDWVLLALELTWIYSFALSTGLGAALHACCTFLANVQPPSLQLDETLITAAAVLEGGLRHLGGWACY